MIARSPFDEAEGVFEEPTGLAPLAPLPAPSGPAKGPSFPPGELEEALDESDFFLAQGLYGEARASLEELLAINAEHPLLREKLAEIDQAEGDVEEEDAAEADADLELGDDSFALAEKLAEELGDEEEAEGEDVLDVDSIFSQFKKGVEEQIAADDTETHFDLGIAYKEMGLIDDAIHEFDLAKATPSKTCSARTMMGLCYMEKGEPQHAVEQFEFALAAPQVSDREEIGLWFELGNAHEAAGDVAEALAQFRRVQQREPTFRGIDERIRALETGQAAEVPVDDDDDDIDQAIDNLFGD